MNDLENWNALVDTKRIFQLALLDSALPTDRIDDNDDYRKVFGDSCDLKPFINIGSGDWRHPFWCNMDYAVPPYDQYGPPDINVDLSNMTRFPLESNSVYLAYTSHTIEHITNDMVNHLFHEVYRVLKIGGVFRISVPDLHTAYCALALEDIRYFDHRSQSRENKGAIIIATSTGHAKGKPIEKLFVNRVASALGNIDAFDGMPLGKYLKEKSQFLSPELIALDLLSKASYATKRPNQHINYWTYEKFEHMLSAAGFRLILRSSYGQSIIPFMRNKVFFDKTRPNESLWVEAIK
jgi:hypothetical protein